MSVLIDGVPIANMAFQNSSNVNITGGTIIGVAGISGSVNGNSTFISTNSNTSRSLATRGAETINVRDFGAIGDGSSHPASTKYGSLAALQAVYGTTISGVTVALTQELDWLGVQLAINTANTSGGGTIYSPPGSFVYTNSNSVSDGSGTLTFPTAGPFSQTGSVSWQGSGFGYMHNWPNDLGSGKFGVLCAGRTNNGSMGFFADLTLNGPGVGTTLGSSSTNMTGIGTNDRRSMHRVSVGGFRVGIDIVGGQFFWEDVLCGQFANCYYGIYYNTPNTGNFGNCQFNRVLSSGLMAAVGVHHTALVGDSVFISCFFGTSPYGFFKETNSGSPTQSAVLYGCEFFSPQFESIGNAVICDDRTSTTRVAVVANTTFYNGQYCWDTVQGTNFHLPAGTAYALFDFFQTQGFTIDGIQEPFQVQPGTLGIFNVSNPNMCIIRGDLTTLIANCVAAASPKTNNFWSTSGNPIGIVQLENIANDIYNWRGTFGYSQAATAASGQIVVFNSGFYGVIPSAGATTDAPAGVVMHNPSPAGSGVPIIIANKGVVNVTTSGSISVPKYLRTTSSGAVIAASGSNDTTTPMVGIALANIGTNVWAVNLRGLI